MSMLSAYLGVIENGFIGDVSSIVFNHFLVGRVQSIRGDYLLFQTVMHMVSTAHITTVRRFQVRLVAIERTEKKMCK